MLALTSRRSFLCAFVLAVLAAIVLLLSGRVGGESGLPTQANAKCGGGLHVQKIDVVSKFPQPFAQQYSKKMRISVKRGERVRKWIAQLYTFNGTLLGESKPQKSMKKYDTTTLKLQQPMQPGRFTIVIKGNVPGCGEEENFKVQKFYDCLQRLPIKPAGRKPGGTASDYGGFVSLKVEPQSKWAPLKKVESTLSNFEGVVYGRAELPRGYRKLFGQVFLNHELTRDLDPGRYSVFIRGTAPQPRSCGDKTKTIKLRFK